MRQARPDCRPKGRFGDLSDTDPAVERIQIELVREMPVWRRVEMVGELREAVLAMALAGLEDRYPGASPAQLRRLLADLVLGESLAAAAYGSRSEAGLSDEIISHGPLASDEN